MPCSNSSKVSVGGTARSEAEELGPSPPPAEASGAWVTGSVKVFTSSFGGRFFPPTLFNTQV